MPVDLSRFVLSASKVFDSLVKTFLNGDIVEEMFRPRRLLGMEELKAVVQDMVRHPLMTVSDESFEKVCTGLCLEGGKGVGKDTDSYVAQSQRLATGAACVAELTVFLCLGNHACVGFDRSCSESHS